MTVRVGIVGAGWIAQVHARVLDGFDDVRIVGVVSRHADSASRLAGSSGARVFDDYRSMLDGVELDAVLVCVPPDLQVEIDLAVVERGIPLFAEKPLGLDMAGPEGVANLIEKKGLVSCVGYQFRYLDVVDMARDLLAAAPPHLILGSWLGDTPGAEWWVRQARSGGQIVEQATHAFDLARYLVGEFEPVSAAGRRVVRPAHPASDIQDVTFTCLRFDSGAIGIVTTTSLLGAGHRIELETISEDLALTLEPAAARLTIMRGSQVAAHQPESDFDTPYERQDRAFVDAVKGRPNLIRSTYADALRTHRATLAAASLAIAEETARR
jgi:predicted dehydrogenase